MRRGAALARVAGGALAVTAGVVLTLCAPAPQQAQAKTSLSSENVTFSYDAEAPYTGTAVRPAVKAYHKGKRIKASSLKVTYSDNVAAGTARITVKGRGSYKGTRRLSFSIYYDMSEAKVTTPRPNYRATGKAVRPKPKVVYRGKTVPASSYAVSYANNVSSGRAKVKVTGLGNYRGSKSRSFKIVDDEGLFVDVSEHDGAIRWKKAAREVDGAILRSHVTYSIGAHAHKKKGDGRMRRDTTYDANASGCEEQGVSYGAYAYLVFQGSTKARVVADAKDQAKKFYANAFSDGHKPLYLALDLEDALMNDEGRNIAYGAEAAAAELRSFAKKDGIEDLKVGLYCGGACYDRFGFTTFDGRYIAANKLDFVWYPAYGKDNGYVPSKTYYPRHANAWDMWQYSSKGRVSGISGYCDVSLTRKNGPHKIALSWYQKR